MKPRNKIRIMDIYAQEDFFNELRKLPAYWTFVEDFSDELMSKDERFWK